MSLRPEVSEAMTKDPAIARRAEYWSSKYREDRTKTVEARVRIIGERLAVEFPALGRKGAEQVAHRVTRDWA